MELLNCVDTFAFHFIHCTFGNARFWDISPSLKMQKKANIISVPVYFEPQNAVRWRVAQGSVYLESRDH
jgi:hypothetical protein